MKRFLALMLLAMVLGFNAPAYALPTLQLDISNGVYDSGTQTIFATQDVFTLYALLNADSNFDENMTYYISAAITPKMAEKLDGDYGSFMFGNETISATSGMEYGDPAGLATHGIYNTFYIERSFTFSSLNKAAEYNVQNNPGSLTVSTSGSLFYSAFNVDTTNLKTGFGVHFDLYAKDASGNVSQFAPWSHDAQSLLTRTTTGTTTTTTTGSTGTTTTGTTGTTTGSTDTTGTGTTTDSNTISNIVNDPGTTTAAAADPGTSSAATPEPATMILLGIGLLGIAGLKRKAQK